MNDDQVVSKILKLLENNTAFIGYALNGGIGTNINVCNTETGKTIQALSINVDSSGEVLVIKDSEDGKYKAVTFKAAEQVTERIIQIRKTRPIDSNPVEVTETNIEVFYLFVKLIDMGVPQSTQLESTWIRKGSSCTQFVGAYERCNYAAKQTIGGTSYTGLPYKTHSTLQSCLNDDLSPDAKTPHGSGDEQGLGAGFQMYVTQMTGDAEQALLAALTSHDEKYNTNYRQIFGYGTIVDCSGAMYVQCWETFFVSENEEFFTRCEFSFFPGFTLDCTLEQQAAGYCDSRGFINSKAPLFGQEEPGQPSLNQVDNTWGHQYGWVNLPYSFMYKRHFFQNYLNGANAQGSFLLLEIGGDQTPTIPPGYVPFTPGCPSGGNGGPYDGSGGNRFPDGPPTPKKRDMKLSTHKAEIWLGSSKKKEAIKLYELGASDLFSGMYNSFIVKADETRVDIGNRLRREDFATEEDYLLHEKFYENWNKNIIDQRIDPKMWVYFLDSLPKMQQNIETLTGNPTNPSLAFFIHPLYNKTLNLSVVDNKTQIIHLKLGLKPINSLSNTDCKGNPAFTGVGTENVPVDYAPTQVWQYQKTITIKVKNWEIESTDSGLDTSDLTDSWNVNYLSRTYLISFRRAAKQNISNASLSFRNRTGLLLLRPNSNVDLNELYSGNHFEQYNYSLATVGRNPNDPFSDKLATLYLDYERVENMTSFSFSEGTRWIGFSTKSWWEMWDKTHYSKKDKKLNSVVGYDPNMNEIYNDSIYNNLGTGNLNFEYFGYIPKQEVKDRLEIPSLISRIRSGINIQNGGAYIYLKDRSLVLRDTGHNFFFADGNLRWADTYEFLLDGQSIPNQPIIGNKTALRSSRRTSSRELTPINKSVGIIYLPQSRFRTSSWKQRLWAQIIYTGSARVDVDSYKDVEFTSPTNPSQYIKFTTDLSSKNNEYNFVDSDFQPKTQLETVFTPGKLEITKQVPIPKPTNVDLDPNMSFLMYMYPIVEISKKTKNF